MPIHKPNHNQDEGKSEFIALFMATEAMQKEYPEESQRLAAAHSTWKASLEKDEWEIHQAINVQLDFRQEMITSHNIKAYQVGGTGEVVKREQNRDGDFVKVRLKITDPVTISQVRARKDAGLPVELSCGYDAHIIPMSGTYNGEHYDAIQTQIRHNHVSMVSAGRAGEQVRLRFDTSSPFDTS